jgi:long-chain acyl-CoA synthetase
MECESTLMKSGFSRGQRLGLVLPNSPVMLASCIAAWRLGGSVALVNPHLKHPPVPDYLRSVDVFGAIVSREVDGLVDVISNAGIPVSSTALNDAVPMIDGRPGTPDTGQGLAALFHTAGAGGDVKAVPITHLNIFTLLESIIEMIPSMDEDDVILNAIPNHHSFGFVVGGIMPIAFGMPQVLIPSLVPPKTTLSAIRQAEVTIIPALPMMLGILIGGEREIAPMSRVKLVFYGGGELMPGLAERVKEVFGVEPLEGYGLTEASSVLAVTPAESAIRPGSSGRILSCFDAEVRDRDGNLQPYNVDGRLWIHGGAVADGYYRADGISSERFRDGWFDTQDIVRIDEDGYITIVSTADDVITVGGTLVYPGEIESILREHPEIADAAVIGVPRGVKGEYVEACVVLKEGSSLRSRDIISFVRRKLPNYKAPRSVRILQELPKDNLGKVLKKELRCG